MAVTDVSISCVARAQEVTNHCMLCHENIAKFREVILCGKYLAIVMEYADGGDLFQAVQVCCRSTPPRLLERKPTQARAWSVAAHLGADPHRGAWLAGGTQESKSQRMNEAMARYFFQQLIAGLSYVHAQVRSRSPLPRFPASPRGISTTNSSVAA